MSDFIAFARACGVLIDRLRADGRIHRCGTASHPKSRNGSYVYDGRRGWAMAWDQGEALQWFGGDTTWTEDERRAWKARQDVEQRYQNRIRREAVRKAHDLMYSARPRRHDYLRMKGFPDHEGLVTDDETLVIPMWASGDRSLQGAQTIFWEDRQWKKKMLYGMRAKGATFRIGRSRRETFLCEGYATGLSIAAALHLVRVDADVLVCFSAGNMRHVAATMTGRVFVAADNDASATGEKVALEIGRPWAMPPTVGQDFNDMHATEGLMAVCKTLMTIRK